MKSKKFLGLVSALTGAVVAFGAASVSAFAEESGTSYSVKYTSYTTEKAGYANPFDYIVATEGGKEVSFKTSDITDFKVYVANEGFTAARTDETLITVDANKDADNDKRYRNADDKGYIWNSSAATIEYLYNDNVAAGNADYYYVDVTIGEQVYETNVMVVKEAPAGSLSYVDFSVAENADKLAEIRASVKEAVSDDSTSYSIPSEVWDLVNSEVYGKSDIQIAVYSAAPNSSFGSANTSTSGSYPSISLGTSGTYYFYILYKDGARGDARNEITTEGLTRREDGWYNSSDELVIPVFSFDYTADSEVTITSEGGGESGFVNYRYNDITFTVKNGTVTSVTLEYSETGDGGWSAAEALASDKSNSSTAVADYDPDAFTASSTAFTPLKKGYFRVVCKAVGTDGVNGVVAVKESNVVSVQREYEEVRLEDQRVQNFFRNNWLSVVFMGLAVLSFIAIIVVWLYKPKAPDAEEKGVKENRADESAEEVTEDETAEEVTEEEPEEEPNEKQTEEVVAEASEEVLSEKEETPVEEAETPAEETPVTEAPAEEVKEEAPVTEAPAEEVKEETSEEPKAE